MPANANNRFESTHFIILLSESPMNQSDIGGKI